MDYARGRPDSSSGTGGHPRFEAHRAEISVGTARSFTPPELSPDIEEAGKMTSAQGRKPFGLTVTAAGSASTASVVQTRLGPASTTSSDIPSLNLSSLR